MHWGNETKKIQKQEKQKKPQNYKVVASPSLPHPHPNIDQTSPM